MKDVSQLVARQYEAYAYPEPIEDLDAAIRGGRIQLGDPSWYAPLLWPEGRSDRAPSILVAGCGTVQAAAIAHGNRDSNVIGLDLSTASLAHERYLQERHALTNLQLFQGDLREAALLGRSFDVIFCTGVLHHLSDPDAGLRALATVLAPRGVLVGMVYAAPRRTGVYMLQDAFRRLGIEQDPAGIAFVRDVLARLPPEHPVHWYTRIADELRIDAALVDTFLHPQDCAYTVPQLRDLVQRAGLEFQGWFEPSLYHPEGYFDPDDPIARRIIALPEHEQWAVMEMLTAVPGTHNFVARPHGHAHRITFADEAWRDLVPHRGPGVTRIGPDRYARGRHEFKLQPAEMLLFDAIDGRRSIAELLAHPRLAAHPADARDAFGRAFFEQAYRLGHVMLSRNAANSHSTVAFGADQSKQFADDDPGRP